MSIQSRPYNKGKDFDSIMRFLADLYERTKSYENWFPDRFENSSDTREDGVNIWEKVEETSTPQKRTIVTLTTRDSPRDFFLHVDPDYRYVEREMIGWIEQQFRKMKKKPEGTEKLCINILEGNPLREALLTELGYRNEKIYGYYRIRKGDSPISEYKCPENFKIRTIERSDYDQLALQIRKVFGHGEWFTAEVLEWIAQCSFYREDLDLVAVTPDGTIASFCTFRLDPNSKIASLEPMGTNPDYRGLGLGKSLITEGIKRSMKYNPPFFYIDGAANNPAANRLYDATGFTEKYAINSWVKEI
ncbi:MAG: GNAT family N-acetyltransferase [Candidatus Heimdallarchaeota archaeon]|nr:MAG: GNAT family N-acetyltransferase [Candidatus Heimdallarchaeota archaeon]